MKGNQKACVVSREREGITFSLFAQTVVSPLTVSLIHKIPHPGMSLLFFLTFTLKLSLTSPSFDILDPFPLQRKNSVFHHVWENLVSRQPFFLYSSLHP